MYAIVGIFILLKMTKSLNHLKRKHRFLKFSADYFTVLNPNNVLQYTQPKGNPQSLDRLSSTWKRFWKKVIDLPKYNPKILIGMFSCRFWYSRILIGDDIKLSQILMNLFEECFQNLPKNGTITVEVHREENKNGKIGVHFSIRDTSVGISRERKNLSRNSPTPLPILNTKEPALGFP